MTLRIFNTLQNYVLKELIVSTLGAAITINLFAFVVSALIFVRKFPVMGITFFLYSAPPLIYLVLPYTLSLGLLVGVTLTFGQIANQREEIIMQFNGISLGIFIRPVLFVSFLGIMSVFFATHYLQPIGFYAEDNRQFDVLKESMQNLPTGANAFSFKTFSLAYEERIEVENTENDEYWFKGLTLLFTKDKKVTQMINAKQGKLLFSKNQYEIYFDLNDCYIVLYKEPFEELPQTIFQKKLNISRKFVNYSTEIASTDNDNENINVRLTPQNPTVKKRRRRIKTMNTFIVAEELINDEQDIQLKENELKLLENLFWDKKDELSDLMHVESEKEEISGDNTDAETIIPIDESDALLKTEKVENEEIIQMELELENMRNEIKEKKEIIKKNKRSLARNKAELYRRFGMSIAPLSFILLGFPLGLLLRQGNKLVVFSLSLLIIGVIYYPIEQYFIRLVQQDLAHPITISILPNFGLLFVAFILSRLLAMR